MSTYPSGDQPSDQPADQPLLDSTALPPSSPFADAGTPAFGTPPVTPQQGPAIPEIPVSRGGLSPRTGMILTRLSPFVALLAFFILRSNDVENAWLVFLLVPVTGLLTGQLGSRRDR